MDQFARLMLIARRVGRRSRKHGVESTERMVGLSRGSGRLQRRVLELLAAAPDRRLDREQLEHVLVETEGFDPSNTLRAIKGLARKRRVGFADRRHKKDSVVTLPRPVRRLTDDEVSRLISKIGGDG